MRTIRTIQLLLLLLLSLATSPLLMVNGFQRICYLLSTGQNVSLIPTKQIDWKLCTHLIFSFADIDGYSIKFSKTMNDYIEQVIQMNQTQVQYLFSIGGSNFTFINDQKLMEKFIDSAISLMDHYKLDGMDLDWEFPYNQKRQFTKLLKLLHYRFKKKLSHRGQPYQLSVALSPVMYIVEMSYDIRAIGQLVDFVNLMTYDFHAPHTFPYTNNNSPLFANPLDKLYFKYFNVYFAVHYMIELGLPAKKIMVGIPFYGYRYFLANRNFHNLYAMSNGTQESVIYSEICREFLQDPQTTIVFDRDSKVPYAYNGNRWITYDDEESIAIKAQWIADRNLGGSMTYALNYDDYQSQCSTGFAKPYPYPLQTKLYHILN